MAKRSNPAFKEWWLRVQEGREELLHFQGQESGHEEIALVQGKEQWLYFAAAAMKIPHVQGKRNTSEMVRAARGIRQQTH